MRAELGIDFGASELRVSVHGKGIVWRSPSVVAFDRGTKELLNFGDVAYETAARYRNVSTTHPFRDGLLASPELARRVLARCLHATFPGEENVRALLSVPCSLTEDQEGSLVELMAQAGFRESYLIYSPVAALVGCGFSLEKPYVSVNIGSSTTDIAVLAEGEITERVSIEVGGDAFCAAIRSYIMKKKRLRINFRIAEEIKRQIGTVWVDGERRHTKTMGLDTEDNWQELNLSSDEMFAAFEEPCAAILEAVCSAAAKIPLDDVEGVFKAGILLTGGGAYLHGMKQMIEGITGFNCLVPKAPEDTVAYGLAALLPELPRKIPGYNASTIAVKSFSFRE